MWAVIQRSGTRLMGFLRSYISFCRRATTPAHRNASLKKKQLNEKKKWQEIIIVFFCCLHPFPTLSPAGSCHCLQGNNSCNFCHDHRTWRTVKTVAAKPPCLCLLCIDHTFSLRMSRNLVHALLKSTSVFTRPSSSIILSDNSPFKLKALQPISHISVCMISEHMKPVLIIHY